jgi:hypothetical protein
MGAEYEQNVSGADTHGVGRDTFAAVDSIR